MTIDNSIPIELYYLKYRIFTRLYQKGKIIFSNMIFFQKQNMVEQSVTKRKEESISVQEVSLVYSTKSCITRGNQDERHELILHCYYQSQKKDRLVETEDNNPLSPMPRSYATSSEQAKIFIIVMTGKQHVGRRHIQILPFDLTSTTFVRSQI